MHANPLIPAKAGTQFCPETTGNRIARLAQRAAEQNKKAWVPAFAGMSGI